MFSFGIYESKYKISEVSISKSKRYGVINTDFFVFSEGEDAHTVYIISEEYSNQLISLI